jgi:hypothetical protein
MNPALAASADAPMENLRAPATFSYLEGVRDTTMSFHELPRLDVVSRVTVQLFVLQVTLATVVACLLGDFFSAYSLILFCLALVQAMSAVASRSTAPPGLNEWDGTLWLAALALAVQIL